MAYFRVSYTTLQAIARDTERFEDVAGFLVLARHASGLPMGNFEPYKLSGAGVNSIHEKAALSEEVARGVVQRLEERGAILALPPDLRKKFAYARWEIVQGELDLELPHAFVDALKGAKVTSPLHRLKDARLRRNGDELKKVSGTELRLDALMTMLAVYRHTSMKAYGGLSPRCVYRGWSVLSQTGKSGCVRWGAEPDQEASARAYLNFMLECIAHTIGPKAKKKDEPSNVQKERFWNAWENIKDAGLVYEAVTLFDTSPDNAKAVALMGLRINDYHAGSIQKTGDPSLLRRYEEVSGAELAYYTPPANERGEAEAMWVLLPDKQGALVGVWRPRFRADNQDAGIWIDRETDEIGKTLQHVLARVQQSYQIQTQQAQTIAQTL